MRLLLDADLSRRWIAGPLEQKGHDVIALQADQARRALPDELVLELATTEERILITRNGRDFEPLSRAWAEEQRSHSGMILVWSVQSDAFNEIVSGVERLLERYPDAETWRNLVVSI